MTLLPSSLRGDRSRSSWWGSPVSARRACLPSLLGAPRSAGSWCFRARAAELERDLPFWVFVDALDEYVQGLEPRRLEFLGDDARAELSHVFPSLVRTR